MKEEKKCLLLLRDILGWAGLGWSGLVWAGGESSSEEGNLSTSYCNV